MKKITIYLFLFALLVFGTSRLSAQTSVAIREHYENSNQSCTASVPWHFYVVCDVGGYSSTDSADIFINYGDGNDTTVRFPAYQNGPTSVIYGSCPQHTYLAQGLYPITYIVTMPDANADTVNTTVMENSTCNNVTGRMYIDVNSDCIYNGGDIPLSYLQMRLAYNGTNVSVASTDAQGLYSLSALPGYTYELGVDGSSSVIPNFTCGTYQDFPVTPAPNASQDLVATNTTAITINYAGDSMAFYTSNCIPYTASLFLYGQALNYNPLTDLLDVYVNFGDGDDTTVAVPLTNSPISYYSLGVNHTYTTAGNYNVMYIVTGPDANADTLIHYNGIVVTDTCGNVEGDIYIDNNSNCVLDAGDSTHMYIWVTLTETSGAMYYAYTSANGHYNFTVPPGNYTVSILQTLTYLPLTPTCPSSGTATVVVTASNSVTADFAVSCPSAYDLSGHFFVSHGIFPTSTGTIYPYLLNQSCTPAAGTVTIILDPLINYAGVCDTSFAPTVNGDTLTWTFASTTAYMNWCYWYNYQGCITIIGDPSLQVGDSVCITMIIEPIAGDINPANNTVTHCYPAFVSFDPNAKDVMPRGTGPLGYVPQNTTFDYTVQFQNTGTTAARDIFILDSLDADLDVSTLVVTGSSHFMQPQILPGNVLKFNFNNIWLPDSTNNEPASHGWVTYRIKAKSNLAPLTPIQNTAGIYFDFNAPVMTNSTLNTVTDPSSVNEISTNEATIFPNPASSTVQIILSKEANAVYTLTDLAGKIVFSAQMQGHNATLDVSTLPQGVYLLNVVTENGTSAHKIIVQH